MWTILRPHYIELLKIAWNDATDDGLVEGAFDLENEAVQRVLKDLAKRVVGIDETTQETIQMIIGRQASEGWSLERVKQELLDRAVTESATRAELIATTESATAYTKGSILAYQESGVVTGLEWLTADESCDICAGLNGKVVALGDEFAEGIPHVPAHPACRCVILPRID